MSQNVLYCNDPKYSVFPYFVQLRLKWMTTLILKQVLAYLKTLVYA